MPDSIRRILTCAAITMVLSLNSYAQLDVELTFDDLKRMENRSESLRSLELIEFSDGNGVLISGGGQHRLWQPQSEATLRTLKMDGEWIAPGSMKFADDKYRFINYSKDKRYFLKVTDAEHAQINSHHIDMEVAFAAWSEDLSRIAIKGKRGDQSLVCVYGIEPWTELARFEIAPFAMDLSANGERLLVAQQGNVNALQLIDIDSKQIEKTSGGFISDTKSIAISPDGRTIAAVGKLAGKMGLSFWDAATLRPQSSDLLLSEQFADQDVFENLEFFPHGNLFAMTARYGIHIVDVESRKLICSLRGRGSSDDLAISADGELLASLHDSKTVAVWRWKDAVRPIESARAIKSHPPGNRQPRLAYSPNGELLAMTCSYEDLKDRSVVGSIGMSVIKSGLDKTKDGASKKSSTTNPPQEINVLMLDPRSGKLTGHVSSSQYRQLKLSNDLSGRVNQPGYFESIQFSPDGKLMTCRESEYDVCYVWRVADKKLMGIQYMYDLTDILFRPSGKELLLLGYEKLIEIENIDQPMERWTEKQIPAEFGRRSISMTSDGEYLLSGLSMFNAKDGAPMFRSTLNNTNYYEDLNCSPDGKFAYAFYGENVVRWDLAAATFSFPFVFHNDANNVRVVDIELTPSGNVLITSSEDGVIRLWNTQTHQLVATLAGHRGLAASIDCSPDGKTVAAACTDGTTRLWDISQFLPDDNGKMKKPAVAPLPTHREFQLESGAVVKVVFDRPASEEEIQAAISEALRLSQVETP